jgi:hypothetical protein
MPTVQHAIDVAAPPEAVWRVFSDLGSWPRWFPFLRATPRGELRAGAEISLAFGAGPPGIPPLPVRVTVAELEPHKRVRWVGGALGIKGDHMFEFSVNIPGLTRVTSRECFSGLGSRLIVGPVFQRLDGEVHHSMARFKALVEATRA